MNPDFDSAMSLAISVVRRCLGGDGIELVEKTPRDFQPRLHRCHENVQEWVARHPQFQHVLGFFVANRYPISDGTLVIAHSAVADADGTLCDITPSELDVRFPFVQHLGTLEEFDLIAARETFTLEVPNSLLRKLGVI